MKAVNTRMTTQTSLTNIALITAGILLIPLVAMQFTNEVPWGREDFIVVGMLVGGTGLLVELVRHNVRNTAYRTALVIGLILLCAYIWAELAVGIFTNWGS